MIGVVGQPVGWPFALGSAGMMWQGKAVKVVRIKRGFLGLGERRKQEQAISRMARKGYRYVDTSKKWGGYDLTFVKDEP